MGLICLASILNDDGMVVCVFLGIFMTQKMLSSLVPCYSIKPRKMIAEQENNSWKDSEKRYSSPKLLKETFE